MSTSSPEHTAPAAADSYLTTDLEAYQPALGRHLQQLREQAGFAREEAASTIGISTHTLRCFEDATWRPSLTRLTRLARLYKADPLDLLAHVTETIRPQTPSEHRILHGLLLFCGVTPEQIAGDMSTPVVEPMSIDLPLGSVLKRRRTHPLRPRIAMTLRREYEAGASIRVLSEEHDLAYGTIRSLLVEAGTKLRGQGGTRTGNQRPVDDATR